MSRRPTCKCGCKDVKRSEDYDAYFCPICMEWVENKCSDPECEYCKDRPDKPLKEWL